jgi:hypothetical protein
LADVAMVTVHDEFMVYSSSSASLPVPAICRDEAAARPARRVQRTMSSRRDDVWNAGQRGERPLKRADRNFAELLQELRVAQTGVQILFAFLLGVAFTDRFGELDDSERGIYIATLGACALTEALLVAPVMLHRLLFQCGLKRELVGIGHRFMVAGLCGLLSAIVGGLLLVIEVCFGGTVAAISGVTIAAVFTSLWAGPALWLRHHSPQVNLDAQPPATAAAPAGGAPAARNVDMRRDRAADAALAADRPARRGPGRAAGHPSGRIAPSAGSDERGPTTRTASTDLACTTTRTSRRTSGPMCWPGGESARPRRVGRRGLLVRRLLCG